MKRDVINDNVVACYAGKGGDFITVLFKKWEDFIIDRHQRRFHNLV